MLIFWRVMVISCRMVPPSYKWVYKPHEYYSYLRIINHSETGVMFTNLGFTNWAPPCVISILFMGIIGNSSSQLTLRFFSSGRQDAPQRESHDFQQIKIPRNGLCQSSLAIIAELVFITLIYMYVCVYIYIYYYITYLYTYIYMCIYPMVDELITFQEKKNLFIYLMAHIFPVTVARHSEAWCFWISRFRDTRRVVLFVQRC